LGIKHLTSAYLIKTAKSFRFQILRVRILFFGFILGLVRQDERLKGKGSVIESNFLQREIL